MNRGWRLRRNPAGALATGDLELITDPIAPLRDGQALVRTLVLSVEAASRIWLGHQRAFMPSVPVGEVMRGIGVGEVIASRRADLRPGDVVAGFLGWQEFCVADDGRLSRRADLCAPTSFVQAPGLLLREGRIAPGRVEQNHPEVPNGRSTLGGRADPGRGE